NNGSFIGKVNGVDVSKQIVVDNSNPGRDIIHVMLPKDTVLKVADQIKRNDQQLIHNGTDKLMSFELQPSAKSTTTTTGNMSMSMGSMGSMSSGSASK
ncbi:MAG: hypothetical protein WCA39_03175, partial [Nitrososphaeraceae archaeon]